MAQTILRCIVTLACVFGLALAVFATLTIVFDEDEDATREIGHEQRLDLLFSEDATAPGRPPELEGDPEDHEAVPTPGAGTEDDAHGALDDEGAPGAADSSRDAAAAGSDPDDVDALLDDIAASRRGSDRAAEDEAAAADDNDAIRSEEAAEAAAREAREADEREEAAARQAEEEREQAEAKAREAEQRERDRAARREAEARESAQADAESAEVARAERTQPAPTARSQTPRERETRAAEQNPDQLRPAVRDAPPSAGAVRRWWPRQPGESGFGLNHAGSLGGEQAIVLIFNAPVHSEAVDEHVRVRDLAGDPVSGNWRVDADNPRAAVMKVPESGRYTVVVNGRLADRSGRALGTNMHGPVFVR